MTAQQQTSTEGSHKQRAVTIAQSSGAHLSLEAMVASEGEGFLRVGLSSGSRAAGLTLGGPLGGAHP